MLFEALLKCVLFYDEFLFDLDSNSRGKRTAWNCSTRHYESGRSDLVEANGDRFGAVQANGRARPGKIPKGNALVHRNVESFATKSAPKLRDIWAEFSYVEFSRKSTHRWEWYSKLTLKSERCVNVTTQEALHEWSKLSLIHFGIKLWVSHEIWNENVWHKATLWIIGRAWRRRSPQTQETPFSLHFF